MLVRDIKGAWENGLIAQSPLWNRHIEKLRPVDLDVFVRSHWGTDQYNSALRQVGALIDQGLNAVAVGSLAEAPRISFYNPTPQQRITVDELCAWLSETTPARRRAVLFGLETGMPIQDIIGLTWKRLLQLGGELPGYALAMANLGARHLRIDYVFWEPMPNMAAAPLFGLGETMFDVSQGMGYDALQRLYRDAIPIDTKADLTAFLTDFYTEHSNVIDGK